MASEIGVQTIQHTNGTDAMTIDSSGRVLLPQLPVASFSDTRTLNISNAVLTSSNFYNHEWVNQGNHLNTSTGNFTCPVDGVYRIFVRFTSTNNTSNVRLQKNDSTINEAYSDAVGGNYTVSSEAVVDCNAGDTLRIQVASLQTAGNKQHHQVTFMFLG